MSWESSNRGLATETNRHLMTIRDGGKWYQTIGQRRDTSTVSMLDMRGFLQFVHVRQDRRAFEAPSKEAAGEEINISHSWNKPRRDAPRVDECTLTSRANRGLTGKKNLPGSEAAFDPIQGDIRSAPTARVAFQYGGLVAGIGAPPPADALLPTAASSTAWRAGLSRR